MARRSHPGVLRGRFAIKLSGIPAATCRSDVSRELLAETPRASNWVAFATHVAPTREEMARRSHPGVLRGRFAAMLSGIPAATCRSDVSRELLAETPRASHCVAVATHVAPTREEMARRSHPGVLRGRFAVKLSGIPAATCRSDMSRELFAEIPNTPSLVAFATHVAPTREVTAHQWRPYLSSRRLLSALTCTRASAFCASRVASLPAALATSSRSFR
jgi:hypothetical protein